MADNLRSKVGLIAAVLAASGTILGASGVAAADPAPTACAASGVTSCTFTSTGTEQTFVVPAGVTGLQVTVVGGHGAPLVSTGNSGVGGTGDAVNAQISVTSGETLYVEVGGNGALNSGGFNGGGTTGYGGGGASDIRTCASATCALTTSDTRLVVAGGGGGGSDEESWAGPSTGNPSEPASGTAPGSNGGNAGAPAGTAGGDAPQLPPYLFPGPTRSFTTGGGGGSQTAGGAAGNTSSGSGNLGSTPGTLGTGGSAGRLNNPGSGGGGYWGGGGGTGDHVTGANAAENGGGASGGGGGSDHVAAAALAPNMTATFAPDPTATPEVVISWSNPSPALPEAPALILLPGVAALGLAGAVGLKRRRRA